MIKIDEIKALSLINESNIEDLKKYINQEIIWQLKTSKTDLQKNKAFVALAKKFNSQKDLNRALAGAFEQDGYSCLCDGFRAFRIKKPIETFAGITRLDEATTPINLKQVIPDVHDLKELEFDVNSFELQYKEFKGLPAKDRKKDKYHVVPKKFFILDLNETEKLYLNIEYLMDAHKILDFNNCKFYGKLNISPLIIVDEEGNQGLVLPIRPPV